MTPQTTFRTLAAALLLLAFSMPAQADDVADCRSKAKMSNEDRLKACNAVDFDDLLLLAVRLLRDDGLLKAREGITSIEEVLRVTSH